MATNVSSTATKAEVRNNLPKALVRRLPSYFRTLIRFYGMGKERISSEELASEMGLAPSQVRTDIKAIGCQGQRSYGYGIPTLYKTLAEILQLSDKLCAVIVGSTPLSDAIAGTQVISKRGIKLKARIADIGACEREGVSAFEELSELYEREAPNVLILAGTAESAVKALNIADEVNARGSFEGIREVWNFTDVHLSSVVTRVKNIHLSDQIMLLCLEAGRESELDV